MPENSKGKNKSKIECFEDIVAWQKAKELTKLIYEETEDLKDFSYRDQLRRASVSIMNNIAEGYERKSDRDFSRFLYFAKGSCGETRSMLDLGLDLEYFDEEIFNQMYSLSLEVSRLLSGFIKSIKPASVEN